MPHCCPHETNTGKKMHHVSIRYVAESKEDFFFHGQPFLTSCLDIHSSDQKWGIITIYHGQSIHITWWKKPAVSSQTIFPDVFQEGFIFSPKLLSSSGSRQNKDLLCSQEQILQDLCNVCSVMTGECHGNHILALSWNKILAFWSAEILLQVD